MNSTLIGSYINNDVFITETKILNGIMLCLNYFPGHIEFPKNKGSDGIKESEKLISNSTNYVLRFNFIQKSAKDILENE